MEVYYMGIKVNESALNELKDILKERSIEDTVLRIFVAGMSWSGPQFNLAVDEQKEDDIVQVEDGFTFVVEKDLVDEFGTFEVKFFEQGDQKGVFIELESPLDSGCAGCSSSCD